MKIPQFLSMALGPSLVLATLVPSSIAGTSSELPRPSMVAAASAGEAPWPEDSPQITWPSRRSTPLSTRNDNRWGEAAVGDTLTIDPGRWSVDDLEFRYKWFHLNSFNDPIPGATGPSYTLTESDFRHGVNVHITAHKKGLPEGRWTAQAVYVGDVPKATIELERHFAFFAERFEVPIKLEWPGVDYVEGEVELFLDGHRVKSRHIAESLENGKLPEGQFSLLLPEELDHGMHTLEVSFRSVGPPAPSRSSEQVWFWVVY